MPTGKIIYVGKAKNLRSRVRQYFSESRPQDVKTMELIARIADIDHHSHGYGDGSVGAGEQPRQDAPAEVQCQA